MENITAVPAGLTTQRKNLTWTPRKNKKLLALLKERVNTQPGRTTNFQAKAFEQVAEILSATFSTSITADTVKSRQAKVK